MKKAAFASKLARRPVPYITLALNYYVHEYEVLGYHLVNTVIHLVTGILVFYFFQTTLTLTQQHRADSPSNRWLVAGATPAEPRVRLPPPAAEYGREGSSDENTRPCRLSILPVASCRAAPVPVE